MVKSEKEQEWKMSVLSPRTVPITKASSQRRTTFGDARLKECAPVGREGIRYSATAIPSNGGMRGSLQLSGKGTWR